MSWHISNHTSLSSQETQAQKLSGTYGKSMYWDPVFGKKSQQELKTRPQESIILQVSAELALLAA